MLGSSGSGKSSLVRAGLLPGLDEDALPGSRTWRVILFMPGSEPLRALANQLVQDLPRIERKDATDRLVSQLGEDENGLRNTLEKSGGVIGALKRFAQRVYEDLEPDDQTIAKNILVRITSLGGSVSDTRRPVPRSDLYPAGMDPATIDCVIEKLSGKDARLVVAGDEGVEVTHESLLREWDTLRGWLEINRDAQRVRQRITVADNRLRPCRQNPPASRPAPARRAQARSATTLAEGPGNVALPLATPFPRCQERNR